LPDTRFEDRVRIFLDKFRDSEKIIA